MSDWLDPLLTRTDDPVSGGAPAGRDKRTLIVEAALDVLLTDGIGKLSMRRVAREAGVALGLAHYYFASKGELIAALVSASARRLHAEDPPETGDGAGPGTWLGRAGGLVTADRVRLSADIDSAALRDPVVAEAAAQRHRDAESEMVRQLAAVTATAAVELGDLPSLSAVLAAALDGLAVRALIDPSFDLPAAHAALQHLLQARLASQGGAAPRWRTTATS